MNVLAAFPLAPTPDGSPEGDRRIADLDALERSLVPQRPRRVGRHARLALVGAAGCARRAPVSLAGPDTGIFLGSGLGNGTEESLVVEQVGHLVAGLRTGPASPTHFANSVSSSASFHVARTTGATGSNVVISQETTSFEGALLAGTLALEAGEVRFALVGGVDEHPPTREAAFQRMDLPASTPLGEGAGWLLLGPGPSLGTLHGPWWLPDHAWSRLAGLVHALHPPERPLLLLPGPGLDEADLRSAAAHMPGILVQPHLPRTGTFATAVALAFADFFDPAAPPAFAVHVTRAPTGLCALAAHRGPPRPLE